MSEPVDKIDDLEPLAPGEPLEPPPSAEELRAAEALRAALEAVATQTDPHADVASPHDDDAALVDVALRARASVGRAPPLSEAARSAAVEAALNAAAPRASRTTSRGSFVRWLAVAALVILATSGALLARRIVLPRAVSPRASVARVLPEDAVARATDSLFGEGLSPEQRASARLDVIVRSRTRGYFAGVAAQLSAERGDVR